VGVEVTVVAVTIKTIAILTLAMMPYTRSVTMKGNYEKSFHFVMGVEGSRSEDPHDPGGRTIWGISEKYHPEVVKKLWNLSDNDAKIEAMAFYRGEFWDKVGGDRLPDKHDLVIFDTAVNQGPGFAKSLVGQPFITILAARIERYCNSATWEHHGKGWMRRLMYLIWEVGK
jgi:hypothetical protein